MNRKMKRQLIL